MVASRCWGRRALDLNGLIDKLIGKIAIAIGGQVRTDVACWPDVVALNQVTSSAWPSGPIHEELAAQCQISLDVFWHGNLLRRGLGPAVAVSVGAPLAPVLWHAAKFLVPDLHLLAIDFFDFPLGFRNGPRFPGSRRHHLSVRKSQYRHSNTSYEAKKHPRSHSFPPCRERLSECDLRAAFVGLPMGVRECYHE